MHDTMIMSKVMLEANALLEQMSLRLDRSGPENEEISTCAKRLANVGSIDEYVSPNASLNSARTSSDVLYPLANSSEYSRSMSSLEQMCLTCGHTVRMCKPKHMLAFMERAYPCIVTHIFKTVGRVLAPSVCKLLLGGD